MTALPPVEKKPPKRPKSITAEEKGQYQLKRLLGEGGFGCVYEAEDVETGERVAVKLELKDHNAQLRTPNKKIQLQKEAEMYTKLQGAAGIAKMHWFGSQGQWAVLVMELLGTSLFDLHRFCNHHFSLKTMLMLADQMLSQIEFLHQQGIIHNDIKPENFCMGAWDKAPSLLHTIDFGLSVQLTRDANTGNYQWQANGSSTLCGTRSFMSIRSHQGNYRSFRDDLEGIAYVLIYLACAGKLPWQKAGCDKKIHEVKSATSVDELCACLPDEFGRYCKYTRQLPYHEMPNYALCRKLFSDLFNAHGFVNDGVYDWHIRARENDTKFQGCLFHLHKKDAGTLTETEVWNRRICVVDIENMQALLFKSEEHMRCKFKIEARIKLDRATVMFTEDSKHENTAFQIHIPAAEKVKTKAELKAEGQRRPKTAKERDQEQSEAEMKKQLFGDGSENYYLQANTVQEVEEWLLQFEAAGAKTKIKRSGKRSSAANRRQSIASAESDVVSDGFFGSRRYRSASKMEESDEVEGLVRNLSGGVLANSDEATDIANKQVEQFDGQETAVRTNGSAQLEAKQRDSETQYVEIQNPESQLMVGCRVWHSARGEGMLEKIDPENARNRPYQVLYDCNERHHYSLGSIAKKCMLCRAQN